MDMKTCNKCSQEKSLDDFRWRNKDRGIKQSYCAECRKVMDRERFKTPDRRKKIYETKKRLQESKKDLVWSFLVGASCVDCGNDNPVVLEFDHIESNKYMEISLMMRNLHADSSIIEEIEKCEIVCANCHRIRTATRAGSWRHARMAE